MIRIESLLSARLFISPQVIDDRLYFISNLSGHLSLYAMDYGGSVPEPLLPPDLALQNPHLIGGRSFYVFPRLGKILVMVDKDGDENYQPMLIPLEGGYPEPSFDDFFAPYRSHLGYCNPENNTFALLCESRSSPTQDTYLANLESGKFTRLASSMYGYFPAAFNDKQDHAILAEGYTTGDVAIFEWQASQPELRLLLGTPLDRRTPGQEVPLTGTFGAEYTPDETGLVIGTALFTDTYGLGYLDMGHPGEIKEVQVEGIQHKGAGEMVSLERLHGNRYCIGYNIDGVSWLYEGSFQKDRLCMRLEFTIVGQQALANGMLESYTYDKANDRYALAFSTATSPTQIYTVEGNDRSKTVLHTRERILAVPEQSLSPGEDASFTSFDGTRVSARLYLPSPALGFQGSRPLVYYIHGGPQGQERPDFAWFSMPLIQYLSMNGFAVFVPNVRGSTGYGLNYTKQVDHDWGGQDRLDHVHAMQILSKDARLDTTRAAVVGRSYGGYMTLTQAARHPQLWSAAADMFGPYDLLTFSDRIPETWKPYFVIALGDPIKDREFLVERSPRTHIDQITCPLLVIQGKNDPRVVERESHDLVEHLRGQGKQVEYLMFENEGHDVLKFENRVTCYNAITEFFRKYLKP